MFPSLLPSERRQQKWNWSSFIALSCLFLAALSSVQVDARRPSSSLHFRSRLPSSLSKGTNVTGLLPVQSNATNSPFKTDGFQNDVQWDSFSLVVKGQRFFLHSGEFHTFRLPVPSMWLDILQKVKATGMNTISVYTHWGYSNPSPGVVDFTGIRALQPLFDAAMEAGIWIILRPGPYINAETTAGGIAHWATSQVKGDLRTNATDYMKAWLPYISGIANLTAPNQITRGGPVIAVQVDNEYSQNGFGRPEYFEELENTLRAAGIVVPTTYNDPGELESFINGTGSVNLYGVDAYPRHFNCSAPDVWSSVVMNYHDYHQNVNPSEPLFFPEFQGGAQVAWGPDSPQYSDCRELTNEQFEDVFYKSLWAANAKMLNFYMIYGGTSWGSLPYPGTVTSYDYGAAITENRQLTEKHVEMKKQGLFIRSSPEFYKTNWVGNSSYPDVVSISNRFAFVIQLKNPDSGANFYIARLTDNTAKNVVNFTMEAKTSAGTIKLPQTVSSITISGRQSKVIVTDYKFGNSRALYSTAPVFFAGRIGTRDVLLLYGDSNQEHEAAIALTGSEGVKTTNSRIKFSSQGTSAELKKTTVIGITTGVKGLVTLWDSTDQLVLFADSDTVAIFSAPVIPSTDTTGDGQAFSNFWSIGSNETVLVGGPYLVRSASVSGTQLALTGDLNASVPLTIIAPATVQNITWNGQLVETNATKGSTVTKFGGFMGQLNFTVASNNVSTDSSGTQNVTAGVISDAGEMIQVTIPELTGWKYADSLPEIQTEFSDASWTLANHTTTNIPDKPLYGDGRVLYGCDYEFCEGIVLWRGHFEGTGKEKSVNFTIDGGEAFAASVWLNDVFLNTTFGNSTNNGNSINQTDQLFTFPADAVKSGKDNVITVVQDNMGNDEFGFGTNLPKSARGIRGFQLNTGNFSEWKVQGKVGGYTNFPDKVRGVLNEGGTFGERQGWHLPGFDTSSWSSRDITNGLPNNTAGVGFFVTTFDLDIPEGVDALLSFTFDGNSSATTQPYRALLFVNGWMMGKRVANLGPQTKFPVHQGILDYNGQNTVAVALWAMESSKVSPSLALTLDGVLQGGVGGIVTNNPAWSAEGRQ
ncbi:glycoside hydrolase family 35 protein [Schizopora paradoxa]|uniref:beta-galactosidase n=1 Tax=Schizopora paradoxa TaxID=27342 RepID=A0A0H2R062_9AGAM|nr:glycoside hydrolase family 35 protein [Schizopora paradoxa]